MSENAIQSDVAPVSTATITTNETPEVVKPEATEAAGQKPEVTEKQELTPEQKNEKWLRTKATKAERNNARLYAENQQMREQLSRFQPQEQSQPNQQPQHVDPVALADHIATAREIAKKSNDVVGDGQKRFASTWTQALSTVMQEAGDLIDTRTYLPTPLGEAILEAADPAGLLNHIGSDPSLAESLSELSPAKLGRAIARIEAEMATKPAKAVSKAPTPINPLSGNQSGANADLESMSQAEYEKMRGKQGARWAR